MKQVVVFPRGQLDAKDKERMSKAGIVAIEADDPSKVIMLLPSSQLIQADDILLAALNGVLSSNSAQEYFGNSLAKRIRSREIKQEEKK